MEKNSDILFLGDRRAGEIAPILEEKFAGRYDPARYHIRCRQLVDEQSTAALAEAAKTALAGATTAVIATGLGDLARGIPAEEYESALRALCQMAKDAGAMGVLLTMPPQKGAKAYNAALRRVAEHFQMRIADVHGRWRHDFGRRAVAPEQAAEFTAAVAAPLIERTQMLVLWQFNGRYAHCNYACPYCYVATSVNKGMHFQYDMEKWEQAFSRHFENQHTVFYFSYGEPMIASKFYDVLEMIGRHPRWEAKITSNVSLKLDRLLETRLAKEGRLNINTSFHPTQIGIEPFLEKCDQLRAAGIEPSIVYVMYPDQMDDFETLYLPRFQQKGYRVHIRAFRGLYRGRKYPGALSREQWNKTAKYMDEANLKYQLCEVSGLGRLSMLGVTHILVDNQGKIEMCDSYVGDRHYGNLFDERLALDLEPKPFPGLVPLAAVDDIADYIELDYADLAGNNVNSYIEQGGVAFAEDGSVIYPYEHVDFNDKKVRKELTAVPKPYVPAWKFWLNPRWFCYHFVYSFLIKKYGKYIVAWFKGKFRLLRQGKLKKENFWHS